MAWKDNFKEDKELILATCSKSGVPNANIVLSLGFIDDKLLLADCQMETTIKNLKENPNICIVSGYYRIKGNVELFSSGKYLDICVQKNKEYGVKNAILVRITEAFDLDKVKKVL